MQWAHPPPGPSHAQRSPTPGGRSWPPKPLPGLRPPTGLIPCPAPTGCGAYRPGLRHLWPRLPHPSNPSGVTPTACPSSAKVAGTCPSSTGNSGQGSQGHGASDSPGNLSGGQHFPSPQGAEPSVPERTWGDTGLHAPLQPPVWVAARLPMPCLSTESWAQRTSTGLQAAQAGPALLTSRQDIGPASCTLGWGQAFLRAPSTCPPGSSTW